MAFQNVKQVTSPIIFSPVFVNMLALLNFPKLSIYISIVEPPKYAQSKTLNMRISLISLDSALYSDFDSHDEQSSA